MLKLIPLLTIIFCVTPSFAADNTFKASAKMSTYQASKLADYAVSGIRFIALQKALKKCKDAKFEHCQLLTLEENKSKASMLQYDAVVKGVAHPGHRVKEWFTTKVNSGMWANVKKFTPMEIKGIKMATLDSAISECEKAQWDYCTVVKVDENHINSQTYINDTNEYAFGAEVTAYVLGIRY